MIEQLLEESKEQALEDYFTLLRFASISSEESYKKDLLNCADWVETYLKSINFTLERWETSGHPVLFAKHCKAEGQPTLLIYTHYDVQPVDPLELWHTPPFEPTLRDGDVFARGAQDNKGQLFYVLWALKTLIEKNGTLPINVKLICEGEEEIGSHGLEEILEAKRQELKADYLAVVDVGIPKEDTPAVTLGVRGIATFQLDVTGSKTDLHSGTHGGVTYNPLHAIVELLARARDDSGKITIPGFYDAVVSLKSDEKQSLSLEFDEENYQKVTGGEPTGGEKAYSPLERAWLRPTLEINGLWGGYTGTGFKTVIPASAHAKLSCRLVPNQDPEKIGQLLKNYFEENAPPGMKVTLHINPGSGTAAIANPQSNIVKAFEKSFSEVFDKPCKKIFEGGSIPISTKLAEAAEAELVLVGLGLISDQIHAPNEHFSVDRLQKGARIIARTIENLSGDIQ